MTIAITKIGELLRAAREELGISCREVAREVGLNSSNYCQYEEGERSPSLHTAVKLAKYFGFSLDELKDSVLLPEESAPDARPE